MVSSALNNARCTHYCTYYPRKQGSSTGISFGSGQEITAFTDGGNHVRFYFFRKQEVFLLLGDRYLYDRLEIEELEWQLPFGPKTEALFLKPSGAAGTTWPELWETTGVHSIPADTN